jgi:pimeloyl-ACP methyl ester carboxylesterase
MRAECRQVVGRRRGESAGCRRDDRLTRPDGRTVAWVETGVLDGRPLLWLPGMPGSRLWFRLDQTPWLERGLRVIVTERPGFGASTSQPGRTFAGHADDLVAVLDTLAIERVPVVGLSGAAPFVLALAARHPDRVHAASIIVGKAPYTEEEARELVGLNAESNRWRGQATTRGSAACRTIVAGTEGAPFKRASCCSPPGIGFSQPCGRVSRNGPGRPYPSGFTRLRVTRLETVGVPCGGRGRMFESCGAHLKTSLHTAHSAV